MDPDETLKQIDELVRARQSVLWNSVAAEAADLCVALNEWLEKGGFEPDWKKFEQGTAYFRYLFP
jgi:hypothetical protein